MNENLSIDDQLMDHIRTVIDKNISNENFSVEDLAKEVGVSRSMLHRKLVKITGRSATDLITHFRLQKAMELLKKDVATVAEIAYNVGFKNPSYFNKVFKKHYNISPGEIRKNHRSSYIDLPSKQITILKKRKHVLFSVSILLLVCFSVFIIQKKYSDPEKSIAVLPLANLTGERDNDYLVNGMHDALIGEIGKIGEIRVISRTSTLRYRESNMLLSEIAAELGVNTILEGSVIRGGDSLSILIQLIDVFPKERHILSKEYHDGMSNVLNLHSLVVKDIAATINVKLSSNEHQLLSRQRTIDPEIYKLYLRGMYSINQGRKEAFEKGLEYLHEAIKRDPGDPFAYAGLALGYATMGHGQLKSEEAFLLARSSAEKAIKLDPTLDEALTALGVLCLDYGWEWARAKEVLESALVNNSSNAIASAHLAWYHVLFKNFGKAIYYGKKAVMLEPLSASYNAWLALLYIHTEEYELAQNYAHKALSLSENIPYGNYALGKICMLKGEYRQAVEYHEKLPTNQVYYKIMLGYAYVKAGQREKALELWNEIEDYAKGNKVNYCYRGMMAAYLGFTDKAFELLNKAIDKKDYPIMYIDTYIYSENIRHDPRFNKLLLRMNLPKSELLLASK